MKLRIRMTVKELMKLAGENIAGGAMSESLRDQEVTIRTPHDLSYYGEDEISLEWTDKDNIQPT